MLRIVGVLGIAMRRKRRNANPVLTPLPIGRMSALRRLFRCRRINMGGAKSVALNRPRLRTQLALVSSDDPLASVHAERVEEAWLDGSSSLNVGFGNRFHYTLSHLVGLA